ncbi:MAG TPA: choice-of-anchor tandem repeat GloVer-containing protein [Candidatus Bathyarchaeia archaeon]|nr:choice-of-anchor tandem repeat GloVer-containing protein [Candidatus Bathyarchaeia archaeon]
MRTARVVTVRGSCFVKTLLVLALFCVAISIASSAQAFTTLTSFGGANGNGPTASLIQGVDGNFYGTTINGGTGMGSDQCLPPYGGCGTVFKVTPSGTITALYSFCSQPNCSDGSFPRSGLVPGADGNYYGTTQNGGTSCPPLGCGTVFKVTPAGTLTILHKFCSQLNCPDGFGPESGLVLASDGNFYGTTQGGGTHFEGTIFRLSPSGDLTTLYNFCSLTNCADGSQPIGGLIQATDGNLYGTTVLGGTLGLGSVFRITLSGALTTLYSFNGNYGSAPVAPLIQASDGNFYGTTQSGGNNNNSCSDGCGTVFKITPGGTLTTLHSFSGPDGGLALAGLVQARDGILYGTTWNAGANGFGTVFKITTGGTFFLLHSFTGFEGGAMEGAFLQATDGTLYGTTGQGGTNNFGTVFTLTLPLQFIPLSPCRLVDTRQTGGPIQGGTVRNFPISQLGGCLIPSNAAAYSLNVTVVPHGPLGYLTIWPQGDVQPLVSTMNSPDGRTKANAAIVAAGNNSVSVYVTDTTDVILDIDGYFINLGLQFYPLTSCRLVDTRTTDGPLGGPRLAAQQERDFPLLMSSCIPDGVNPVAYSLNFTAVPSPSHQPLGYLTVWPTGRPRQLVSTLNNPTGTVVANAAIVLAGQNDEVAVYPSDTTDLLIDINGYFAPVGQGGYSFYPATPCRAYDSRNNNGQPFSGPITVNVVGGPCAQPANVAAYVFNATVVPSGRLPYLTLWPDTEPEPVVSTLNAYDGEVTSNMAVVSNLDGSTSADAAEGYTQLILDIAGYFAP